MGTIVPRWRFGPNRPLDAVQDDIRTNLLRDAHFWQAICDMEGTSQRNGTDGPNIDT